MAMMKGRTILPFDGALYSAEVSAAIQRAQLRSALNGHGHASDPYKVPFVVEKSGGNALQRRGTTLDQEGSRWCGCHSR